MANNVTREKNLEALANAIKNYADSKLATVSGGGASYTLPTASTTQKGGIKVGTGLSMAGDTLNVTIASEAYTLPTASTSTKGGIKVGTGLSMSGDTLNCTIDSGETYSEATTLTAGLMSASDKAKLDTLTSGKNVIAGTGLAFNGDTLNCTLSGGSTGGTGSELVLSNVESTVNGAMWISSLTASTAGEAITLSTLMPATVVNGSMWLEI